MQTVLYFFEDSGTQQGTLHDLIQFFFILDAMQSWTIGNIVIDRHGERIGLLEYHTHLFTKQCGIHPLIVNVLSVQDHFSFDSAAIHQIIHPVQAAQESGFSAATGTDKCGDGMICDLHIYIFQCVVLSVMEI